MAMSSVKWDQIARNLLRFNETIEPAELFPVVEPKAYGLVTQDAYAFCIAACLDRGAKADIIWTIPYDIKTILGHLDPFRIDKMSLETLQDLFAGLPRKPRFVNAAPRTIQELTRLIVKQHHGDAAKIWQGKRAVEVKQTFIRIYGVGEGIANMAVLLIERAFRLRFTVSPATFERLMAARKALTDLLGNRANSNHQPGPDLGFASGSPALATYPPTNAIPV